MSAYLQSPVIITSSQPRREAIFETAAESDSIQPLSVRSSAAFSVAPARLFYALTIPEYIETWLTPPDSDEIRCTGNPTTGEALSIELRSNHRVTASILAEYKSISPQDLNIRWYVRSRTRTCVSQLRVAIRTVRADALLRIRHSGFANPSDWHWHQELWGLSLTKMQMLIR
ncbi:SRPBCC domain-containing protein [Alloacidobacterium dinghuense]|uniref:SRPBCC domain-containing protein n=1 Tax=Alloacidobacterium dinghuense TaxID=2763107 RepID=A0A7G8BNG9_9BACT|nr:SRPBCC domain-containing protein [Alloacidobacterium dinghuense]QNI34089.1 SRPBCC domain-containing protein [Alloacidobacterium dinghuense]